MNKYPTLKVIPYSRMECMDMVMENIRETGTLVKKQNIINKKNNNEKINKDKFNLLMKKSITDMKKKIDKKNNIKKDTLNKINYDKELKEIDILIDIVKKTGNVPNKQTHKPMVHVPLPKEFYELKPLVSFRNPTKNINKKSSSNLQMMINENVQRHMPSNISYDQHLDVPKDFQSHVIVRNILDNYHDNINLSKAKEKQRVDVGTSMTSRSKTKVDKAILTTQYKPAADKETLTTQRSLSSDQLDNINEQNLKQESVPETEKELKIVDTKKDKSGKYEDESDDLPPFREMSTIASYSPRDNRLINLYSFENLPDINGFQQVQDDNDLYVGGGGWTVIDPPEDPWKDAIVVKLIKPSKQSSSSEGVYESKSESKSDESLNSDNVLKDESSNESTKFMQPKQIAGWNILYTEKSLKELNQQSEHTQTEDNESDEPSQKYFINQPPELDLTPAHKYNKKQSQINGLNANWDNIDMELQEDFNNLEKDLYKPINSEDRDKETNDTSEKIKEYNKKDKETKENKEKAKEEKEEQKNKNTKQTQNDIKPKRRRSKSQKRSKKKIPDVHLSDYKGFYVVHTTNDWTFS